jgi:hypothetical protein
MILFVVVETTAYIRMIVVMGISTGVEIPVENSFYTDPPEPS